MQFQRVAEAKHRAAALFRGPYRIEGRQARRVGGGADPPGKGSDGWSLSIRSIRSIQSICGFRPIKPKKSGSGVLKAHAVHSTAVDQQHAAQSIPCSGTEHAAQSTDARHQKRKSLVHGFGKPKTHGNLAVHLSERYFTCAQTINTNKVSLLLTSFETFAQVNFTMSYKIILDSYWKRCRISSKRSV